MKNKSTKGRMPEPTATSDAAAEARNEPTARKKLLYTASTQSHLTRFHAPYIEELRKICDVYLMANGGDVDFPIPFEKKMFCAANLRAVRQIRKILKRERFDAVILNTSLAAFLIRAAMIGMRHRPRVLNVVHGYLFSDPPKGKKDRLLLQCERMTRRQTDEIAVMNAEDMKTVSSRRLCFGKVHFLRGMGYRFPEELPVPDRELRSSFAGEGEYLLTFVGELSKRKNQLFLIRALERLRREGLPVRLMLVGDGGEREALEQEIARLGLTDAVFLTGNREPVIPYLAITDVYVSASRIEGLPFNLMEAMACGLPVVASDVKGQSDLLVNAPGCLYPLDDMEAFCTAVRAALGSGRKTGVGSNSYPGLENYRLDAVLEENLNLMKGFLL